MGQHQECRCLIASIRFSQNTVLVPNWPKALSFPSNYIIMCLHFSAKSPSPPQQIWPFFQTRLLSGSVNALFSVHSFDPPLCCVNNCVVFLRRRLSSQERLRNHLRIFRVQHTVLFNPLSCWQSKFPLSLCLYRVAASMPKAVHVPFYKIHKIIRMLCICGGGAPSFSPCLRIVQKK